MLSEDLGAGKEPGGRSSADGRWARWARGRFSISSSTEGERHVLALAGELDLAAAPRLERAVAEIGAGVRQLVLDLRGLEFIDASGLRAVLAAREAAGRDGREFALVPGTGQVERVFTLTGLMSRLPVRGPVVARPPAGDGG